MGFLNNSSYVIDAILTKKAREHLRTALLGQNQNDEHVIVKFALSDDGIDYGLWEDYPDANSNIAQGDVIANQPLTEPPFSDNETMKYFIYKMEGSSD